MIATALAADRVAAAAPVLRPQIGQTVRWIGDRLTRSFREVVPAQRVEPARAVRLAAAAPDRIAVDQAIVHATAPDPFQYRLPPPAR